MLYSIDRLAPEKLYFGNKKESNASDTLFREISQTLFSKEVDLDEQEEALEHCITKSPAEAKDPNIINARREFHSFRIFLKNQKNDFKQCKNLQGEDDVLHSKAEREQRRKDRLLNKIFAGHNSKSNFTLPWGV